MFPESNPNPVLLNEAAFKDYYMLLFKPLCLISFRVVKDMEIAREITQDAFAHLWEKRNHIDVSRSVKSYLHTTVYNRSLNHLRDHRKFSPDLFALEKISPGESSVVSDPLVFKDLKSKIDKAIEALPEKCKEIFLMSRMQQLKYHEIADLQQISVKTVEAQMSKALAHMRLHLNDYLVWIICFFLMNT